MAPVNPSVYMKISQGSSSSSERIQIELYADKAPLSAANFLANCIDQNNLPFHYKGMAFSKDMRRKGCYAGDSEQSIYGSAYPLEVSENSRIVPNSVYLVASDDEKTLGSRFYLSPSGNLDINETFVVIGHVTKDPAGVVTKMWTSSDGEFKIADCGRV